MLVCNCYDGNDCKCKICWETNPIFFGIFVVSNIQKEEEATNLISLPRSNIVGLVGIECGYGNDLELFPPATAEVADGPGAPIVPRCPLTACPLCPDRAVVVISPLL